MQLEINLNNIQRIAEEKEQENLSFHLFLKEQDGEKVDTLVQRLKEEITPQIDCLDCGNCCRNLRPIAKNEVLRQFVDEADIEKVKYVMSFPCSHLDGNKCKIYTERPEECRSYPYLDMDGFVSRALGMIQNYKICPIVFNVIEDLKKELEWKSNEKTSH